MDSLDSKKKTFIEMAIGLVTLLTGLAFALGTNSFYFPYVAGFDVLFIISAFVSVATLLFKTETQSRFVERYAPFAHVLLGMSFGVLTMTGVAQALSLIPGEYPTVLVYAGATFALSGSMLGPMWLFIGVLGLGTTRREPPFYVR